MSSKHTDDPVPAHKRATVLDRDGHQCQLCGVAGYEGDGCAQLEVHHIIPDPDDGDRHDINNLITLCKSCHSWIHKRPTRDDVPVDITTADTTELLPHDYEILRILHEAGPLSTGDITNRLSPDLSTVAVRERLYLLMGLDNIIESRDEQLIDQDWLSGDWGLADDVAHSSRGRIPENDQALIQRIEDEQVRRALDRGCSRELTAKVLDVHPRTTWHKQRRAQAYDIPLDALQQNDSSQLNSGLGVDDGQRQLSTDRAANEQDTSSR